MPRAFRPILAALLALLAAPHAARAQRPVGEYEVAGRYRTLGLSLQMTGPVDDGRDVLVGWGRMYPAGRRGTWVPGWELAGGIKPGTKSFLERVLAGPRASLGRAFPSQHMSLGRKTRGEPYVLAAAGAYGIVDFEGEGTDFGGAPFVAAGAGLRLFNDPWDVALTTLEVVVEQRFGFGDEGPQVHLRFGQAIPPRAPAEPRETPIVLLPPDPASFLPAAASSASSSAESRASR